MVADMTDKQLGSLKASARPSLSIPDDAQRRGKAGKNRARWGRGNQAKARLFARFLDSSAEGYKQCTVQSPLQSPRPRPHGRLIRR